MARRRADRQHQDQVVRFGTLGHQGSDRGEIGDAEGAAYGQPFGHAGAENPGHPQGFRTALVSTFAPNCKAGAFHVRAL